MICGNCHEQHETSDEVRNCYSMAGKITGDQITSNPKGKRGQYELIQDLLAERDMTPLPPYEEAKHQISKSQASSMISRLIHNIPRLPGKKAGPTDKVLPDVPEGFYAVPDLTKQNDYKFLRVDRPTEGQWAGMTFGHQVVGGKPAFKIQFESLLGLLRQISEMGAVESGMLYARELRRCRHCGRHLTKYASRVLSAGPDCAEKHGYGDQWFMIQQNWEAKFGKDAKVPDDVQQVRPKVAPTLSTAGRSPRTSRGARTAGAMRGSGRRAS